MNESIDQVVKRVQDSQRNYEDNLTFIEQILMDERGYVTRKPKKENVVALCSGGLDSSIMVEKIIEDYNLALFPIFFKRGARNEVFEEDAFDYFIDFYSKKFPKNIKEPYKTSFQIPPKDMKKDFPKNFVLSIGHPMRNSTMQNLAVMYAVSLNGKYDLDIKTVFSGSVGEDYTEPELGLLSLRTQTLNTCISMGDWSWQITSPLTDPYLTNPIFKKDLIRYAIQKNIPLEKTRTCFSKNKTADGTCFACIKRLNAFKEIGITDPIKYKNKSASHKNGKNN